MITIQVSAIQAARKLLTRIHFERLKLPVLNHALATVDAAGLTLAVTDLDHWLETRLPATFDRTLSGSARFLIPAAALAAAASGDKGSTVQFECPSTPDPNRTLLKLTVTCGGMPVQTVYQPDSAADFPVRPTVKGQITTVPKETLRALQTVAVCASTDTTRSVLNGVLFLADATVPETQRLALISRLRSLDGKGNSVRLTWDKPGHLTLTLRDSDATAARIDAPVVTTGQPPVIALARRIWRTPSPSAPPCVSSTG